MKITGFLISQKKSEFQRHIEARQIISGTKFSARKIVNAVTAFFNDAQYLRQSVFDGVAQFKGAAGAKASIVNREYDGMKKWPISIVKRTVDEDVAFVIGRSHALLLRRLFAISLRDRFPDALAA